MMQQAVADGVNPGDVPNFAAMTTVPAQIDLDLAAQGGMIVTGPIYGGGDTTQYEYLNTNNYASITDARYYTESESDARFAAIAHTHDLMRYSLRAPGNVDSLTSSNFRDQLFGTSSNGWTISTARWNSVPSGLSGMNMYGTMFAWSGSDTHGFIATDYSTANIQVGGGSGNSITWKATLIHSSNIGSYALTSLPAHTHDDRYYTESESDSRYLYYRGVNAETDFQRFQDGVGEVRFDQINDYNNLSNAPGGYNYGGVLSMRGDNFGFQIWGSHTGDLYYKTQWSGDNYTGWRSIITSINIGSQSVNYASSAGSVAWVNVSGRPTLVSSFTNDSGYITSASLSSYVPTSRTITINGVGYDLSANRSWTVSGTDNTKLPLAGGTMSGTIVLKSISGVAQTVPNEFGAYLHLGDWGIGRTDPRAVLVNTAYRADYADSLFDMNISRFTNNSGYVTSSGSVAYATSSTRLYASDSPYRYTDANPYYLYMNYDGGSYWELKVSPATPGTVRVAYANTAGSAGSASTSSQVTINYNNDSNSTYQLLWGSGNSVYGTSQVYVNPSSDVIYARGGYISPGNPWGTADSAFFPNGITTAGGTNWIYGRTYVGNAPGNGNGHQFETNGNMYSTGHHYLDSNYGQTIVGRYSSTVYQGIFAMGDSYKLPMDGSSTGSLYGLAWSHPNAGGVAGNLNTHGLLVMENGTFLAAISGSIRARDDVRAPALYDSGSRVAISRGEGRNYVDYSRYVYNNGAYSGSGWVEPSDLGVRYAASANYASSSGSSGSTSAVNSTGWGNGNFTWYQTPGGLSPYGGSWASFLISNHGDGSNYYNQTIIMPFWGPPQYSRREGGTNRGPYTFWSTENLDPYNLGSSLSVTGSITASSDIIAYSDARIKTNVITINNALEKVLSLRGVTYTRTDSDDIKEKIGVIAQEVQKVLPQVVFEQSNGLLGVSYGNMIGVLIEAIKDQQKEIEELKAKLN